MSTHHSFSVETEGAQFQPGHTSLILDQGQSSGFSGFLDGQLGLDDGFAIYPSIRIQLPPDQTFARSASQSTVFDPANPPEGPFVGRKFQFKEPGPFGPT